MCRQVFVLVALVGLAACEEPFDTTRQPVDTGTFGATVFTLSCKRVAFSADPTDVSGDTYRQYCRDGSDPPAQPLPVVEALGNERPQLVGAVDATFPKRFLDPLQGFLTSADFLPVYDDGTAEAAADRLAALFGVMAGDADFLGAMARLDFRLGYRPAYAQPGVLRQVSAYPGLDGFLLAITGALAPGGVAHDELTALADAAAHELTNAVAATSRDAPDRTLNLARGLFLSESALLGTGKPMWLAVRDGRGVAVVAKPISAPFVDKDNDGFADIDASGRFVDAAGQPIDAPAPFSVAWRPDGAKRGSDGRAQTAAGQPLYQFVDLDKTVLAALGRDLADLVSPTKGTAGDLVRGAATLLGPRVSVTKTYPIGTPLTYRGFDPSGAALLDMVYGYLHVLADPAADDTLGLVRALVADHEAQAARLLEAMFDATDLGKTFPGAKLTPGSALYDDLIPVVVQILNEPGLAEDLLRALEDPATRQLGKTFADLMRYDDAIVYDEDSQAVVGSLRTPVDRSKPDSGYNRSALQRVLHLLNDAAGVRMCNKDGAVVTFFGFPTTLPYDECGLLEVDDLAVFYVQSIAYAKDAAGNVRLDDEGRPLPKAVLNLDLPFYLAPFVTDSLMESQSTIIGFRKHPTPEALNRIMFLPVMPDFLAAAMDPPVCKDGDRFIDAHYGTLPALELGGFYDRIRPLLQVFADHDREDLFVETLVILHSHWPSTSSAQHQRTNPSGHGYAKESDIHSYEPLVSAILDEDLLWGALVEGAPTLDAIRAPSGQAAPEVLAAAARFLFGADSLLTNRAGAHTTTTEDGRLVPVLSPWYVLADAYKAKRAQIAAAGSEGALWQTGVSQLVDVLLRGVNAGGTWRFTDPRTRGVSLALIDFLRARLAAHRQAGDLAAWLKTDLPGDVQRIFTGPVFAAAADLVVALATGAPDAWTAVENLLVYLHGDGTLPFQATTTVVADLLQWYADDADLLPLTHTAGRIVDPGLGVVDAQLTFARRARQADKAQVVATLLGNLDDETAPGRTSLATIVDVVSEVDRVHPFTDLGKPLSAGDYAQVFQTVQSFLDDEKRGLKRFITVVANRHVDE
jgi:hypothetical protein